MQPLLQAQLGGAAGEAMLRGAVRGLADSLPPSAVPRVADVLAPLLHSPGWAGGLHGWAAAAIADVPAVHGVPDEAARRALLQVLVTLPDPCPPTGIDLDAISALEADELRPVRLALGLPVPTEALAIEAAASLLRAGVCVGDMAAKGYPEIFIDAMRKAAAANMGRL